MACKNRECWVSCKADDFCLFIGLPDEIEKCMRAGFLCPKCDNFAYWHTRQDQNDELHLKRWFFFAKIVIFCKSITGSLPTKWLSGLLKSECLFTCPPRSKWASSEKMIWKSIVGPLLSVVQAYTQPYSLGGRIKLIICQIRHELSVTIHEIMVR